MFNKLASAEASLLIKSSRFRRDQISKCKKYDLGNTYLCCLCELDVQRAHLWGPASLERLSLTKAKQQSDNKIISLTILNLVTWLSVALDVTKFIMEQRALKNVNNCLNTKIYSYLETSGGQHSNLYFNVVHFFQHQY
jgi:hypothetical protein